MIAIREKHIHSVRYLWQMFVYTSNMFLILLIAGFLRWCTLLLDLEKLNTLFAMLSPEVAVLVDNNGDIRTAGFLLLILEVLVLCSIGRFVDYDMEHRRGSRKLLFCLGYRRSAVLRYEAAYFLADFLIAWILGELLLGLVWLFVRRISLIQTFLLVMEVETFLGAGGFLVTGAVTMTAVTLMVAWRILMNKG